MARVPRTRRPAPTRVLLWLAAGLCAASALAATGVATADDAIDRGLEALDSGDLTEAETRFRGAASADAAFYLGITLQHQERHAEAATAFADALARDPAYTDAWTPLGIAHLRSGEGAAAAAAFAQALVHDPEDATAHFFTGLQHQRAERCAQAIPHFEAAAQDPDLAATAEFNLAVCAGRLGYEARAQTALARVIEIAPNSPIADEARVLQDAYAIGEPADDDKIWSVAASAGFSFDDNVIQDDLDVDSGTSDVAGLFEFSPSVRVYRDATTEVELGYDLFQSLYAEEDGFDLQSHGLYGEAHHAVGNLDLGLSYRWSHSTLGGDDFLSSHGLRPSLGYALRPEWYLQTGYSFAARDFESSGRDAATHGLFLENYYFLDDRRGHLRLAYRFEGENAHDPQFDNLAHHLSVGAWVDAALLRLPSVIARRLEMALVYKFATYDFAHSTPTIGERREDTRHGLEFSLTRQLRDAVALHLEYEFSAADSNLPSADYQQNVLTLRIGAEF